MSHKNKYTTYNGMQIDNIWIVNDERRNRRMQDKETGYYKTFKIS